MASKKTHHGARTNAVRRAPKRTGAATRSSSRSAPSAARVAGSRAPRRAPRPAPRRRSSPRPRWLTALGVAVAVVAIAWYFYPVAKVQYHEQRQRDLLARELAAVKSRNALLKAQVDRLKTPEGVEDLARTKMGYVRKGEHAYVVTGWQAEEPTETPETPAPAAGSEPFVYRILDALFGAGG